MNYAKILTVILCVAGSLPATQATQSSPAQTLVRIKATYLGVAVNPVKPADARKLKLAPDTGLQVFYVAPKSPAEEAGLKVGDVLVKLDDQWLINVQQFAVLMRSYQPRQHAAIKIYRGTGPQTVTARMGQEEIIFAGAAVEQAAAAVEQAAAASPNTYLATSSDDKYSLKLTAANGEKCLTVQDARTGQTIFNGPVNTPGDRKSLPADVLSRLQALQPDRLRLQAAIQDQAGCVPTEILYNTPLHDMTLRVDGKGQKNLIVKDKAGATLFNSPVNTPGQIQALPPEFLQRFKAMENACQSQNAATSTQPEK